MPLANQIVNSLNGTTSAFITRSEVIQGLSTIANDLSGFNFSNIFANPNPLFSTVTVNAGGSVLGANIIGAGSAYQISSVVETYNRMFASAADPFVLGVRTNTGAANQYVPLALQQLWLKNTIFTNEPTTVIGPTSFNYATSIGTNYPIINLNTATNTVALSNISSLNGVNPTTAGTTFTSLTGSNITMTGTLTSPQIVSLSSINGAAYTPVFNSSYTGQFSVTAPANSNAVLITSITLPAGTLKPNTSYLFDVPLTFVSIPPAQPTNFVLNIGLRLGNNGQINYQYPLFINNFSQSLGLSLSGVAQTNAVSVTSQTIDLICVQNTGSNFTCTFAAPSAGGANTYTLKQLI
jgi:hypothetical protein